MKRIVCAVMAAVMLAALAGCRGIGKPAVSTTETAAPATAQPTEAPAAESTPARGNPLTGLDGDSGGRRPIAVSVRTGEGSQPQWGVASADVLIEGVTEGKAAGLTALFANADSISKVGPVAAGRDLFLQFALPLNAVSVSINKNIYAQNLINALSYQDLDGYHIGTAAFAFDDGRQGSGFREENCWYTTRDLVLGGLQSYGMTDTGDTTQLFSFGQRPAPESRNGTDLFLTFSDEDTEELVFDASTGVYLKNNADGSPMMDADSGQQAAFTNVFVLYASSGIKDDGYTRQYDLSGGKGIYLTGGAWQEIQWQKGDATAPLVVKDTAGSLLQVNPGKSFLAVWGGYYGQGLRLLAEDGSEQTLPEKPALLDSGIPDDAAATAEQAYREQQDAIAASEAALAESEAAASAAEAAGEQSPAPDAADSAAATAAP